MKYALWREESPAGAVLFDCEEAALRVVESAFVDLGPRIVAGWSLVRAPDRGDWETVVEGDALIARAIPWWRPS